MCGIIGYTGSRQAVPILLEGLAALEYRGYDSAGIAVHEDGISTVKTKGKIQNLCDRINAGKKIEGSCGIGHTRWATHGEPSEINAHPHSSEHLTLVHNGIIENYAELRDFLKNEGYHFRSETDTEVAAHLMDYYYRQGRDPFEAVSLAVGRFRGSYAFCVMFGCDRATIWAVRRGSPLVCATSPDGSIISSDITAILPHTRNYFQPDEDVIIKVTPGQIKFFASDGSAVSCDKKHIDWNVESAQKHGYNHFMLKEINEQADAVRNTVMPRLLDGIPYFGCDIIDRDAEQIKAIKIIGCGTAMHAGLVGKHVIENLARIPTEVEIASEFRYGNPIFAENTLVILISQSGETADTIAALNLSRERGAKTLAIVNVVGSSIARLADYTIYTHAGPEISVASTKAYTVQCAVLYQLAFRLSLARRRISEEECRMLCNQQLDRLPEAIDAVLRMSGRIKRMAQKLYDSNDIFFIGRGIDSHICCEGSLKLKEISYIHSESYPAGELKHGTISLIDKCVPVIAVVTVSSVCEKTKSNIREVKARGATVFSFCTPGCDSAMREVSDYMLVLPEINELFAPAVAAVALQLLAYYTAVARGCDVDKPRNLAKSVTVE